MFSLTEIDQTWHHLFAPHIKDIDALLSSLQGKDIAPIRESIFKAFRLPLDDVKVLILGQDPYPTEGVADGLAFSASGGNVIPASLRNIFTELCSDLNLARPSTTNLSPWSRQGVLLLNTSLTTETGARDLHKFIGWDGLISDIVAELASRKIVAILWGNSARRTGIAFEFKVESTHPSPLSAFKGFFGSQPFSSANRLLQKQGIEPIDWKLP